MPTYRYQCTVCGAFLELEQSIKDRKIPVCNMPPCNGSKMETVITATSFVLKGPGWAKDGYK